MIFHENRLLVDDSHLISYLIFSKIRKDVATVVVWCSCNWRFSDKPAFYYPYQLICISYLQSQQPLGLRYPGHSGVEVPCFLEMWGF